MVEIGGRAKYRIEENSNSSQIWLFDLEEIWTFQNSNFEIK